MNGAGLLTSAGEATGTMQLVRRITSAFRFRRSPGEPATVAVVDGVPLPDDSPLVQQTAERLRQREQAAGGWAAEAGGLPVEAYLPEARRLVQRVAFGLADGESPTP
jgi:hypothetical protein